MGINSEKTEKRPSFKKSQTPPRKRSSLAQATFDSPNKFISPTKIKMKKLNLEIDPEAEKIPSSNLVFNEENINEIFDKDYEDKIESNVIKIWETAEKKIKEELETIENQMERFLDDLANEKFKKTLEINNKYDNELKNLECDIDLSKNF